MRKRFVLWALLALVGWSATPVYAYEGYIKLDVSRSGVPWTTAGGGPYWLRINNAATTDTNGVHNKYQAPVAGDTTYTFTSAENAVMNTSKGAGGCPARALKVTVCDINGANDNGISANDVTITGTNVLGESISEIYNVVANTAGTILGTKAFYSISTCTIGVQDDNGVRVSIGCDEGLGMPFTIPFNTVLLHYADGVGTSLTVVADVDEIEKNLLKFTDVDLNGVIDVDALIWVPPYGSTGTVAKY